MIQRNNQKKLVEAFKTFFDKSVAPSLSNNESVLNEWKYFNKLISTEPIDFNQIQFYLLLANKSQSPSQYKTVTLNEGSGKYGLGHEKSGWQVTDKRKKVNSPKKKKLLNCLQSFHGLLFKNHEKLESYNKREASNQTISGSGTNKRYL